LNRIRSSPGIDRGTEKKIDFPLQLLLPGRRAEGDAGDGVSSLAGDKAQVILTDKTQLLHPDSGGNKNRFRVAGAERSQIGKFPHRIQFQLFQQKFSIIGTPRQKSIAGQKSPGRLATMPITPGCQRSSAKTMEHSPPSPPCSSLSIA
jgi:hypothetical protein